MHCDHCVMRITKSLKQVGGVDKVNVNLKTKEVQVAHTDIVSRGEMAQAIKAAGYTVEEQ